MIDLSINETGDLLFAEKTDEQKPQKISFTYSNTTTQKISINIYDVETVNHNSNKYLSINFFIKKDTPKIIASTCTEDLALAQLIVLKLKTALGELPERSDFGSKMSLFKHENISDQNMRALEIYLKNLLKNDILAINVKATPYIDYDNGYKQSVMIQIYSDSNLILDYKIER